MPHLLYVPAYKFSQILYFVQTLRLKFWQAPYSLELLNFNFHKCPTPYKL